MSSYDTNIKEKSLHGIANGILQCARIVGQTMGSKGLNVLLEEEFYPYTRTTNDGSTIISKIRLEDPLENIGHTLLTEATERSNKNAGDGSSTTVVLLNAILQESLKSTASPMEIKKSLDALLPVIIQKIDSQKIIITPDEVDKVASIAGESESLGATLREIYKVIGKDGIIHLESSGTYETSYKITEGGVKLKNASWVSDYLAHDEQAEKANRKQTRAIYFNPAILITRRKIQSMNEVYPIMEKLQELGKKDLVIFTDDMDSGVVSTLIQIHTSKAFNILIIKAPTLFKQYVFDDFAKITGATIVDEVTGVNFNNLKMEHLGTCGKIETDKEETIVSGIVDISDHIAELKAQGDTDSLWRVSYLTLKTAILRLGTKSETEATYLLLKAEDAIRASQLALNDGVVAGGGVCLLNVSHEMPDTVGGSILKVALQSPIRQILSNASIPEGRIGELQGNQGFDTTTGEIVDMVKAGIVDASLITKNAVKNALGIASTLITASTVITKPKKTLEQIAIDNMQQKGLRF